MLRASLDAAAARVGARDAAELLDAVAGAAALARAHPPSPMRRTLPVTGTPPAAVALVDAEERARFLRGRRDVRRSALIGHDGAALEESEGDDTAAALRAVFGEGRRQRAIGVSYKKHREALSHYVRASLTTQFDAWIHVDVSTALVPL